MSRSLITGGIPVGAGRNVLNPVTVMGGAVLVTSTCGSGGFALTKPQKAMLNTIEKNYTIHLLDQKYEKIPNDLETYLTLYSALTRTQVSYRTNSDVTLLLKITEEALAGAINAYGLNARIIELHIQNLYLQEVIETMISGVNIKPAFDMNDGSIQIVKELKLAPLFLYYMQTYGTPEPGDGFDPDKLTLIYNTLIQNGIDPGIVNIESVVPPETCTTKTALVELYSRLALFVGSVKTLQDEYAAGNASTVATILTADTYSEMVTQLNALAYDLNIPGDRALETVSDLYTDYEKIRTNTGSGLTSLQKAVEQHAILMDTESKLQSAEEKVAILLDPVKLKEYIEKLNSQSRITLFPDSTIQVKKATIKPEFAEYVKRYGYPPGGAFDPDKLGKIKNELNLTRTTQQQKPKTPQSELNAFIQRSIALKSHKQK